MKQGVQWLQSLLHNHLCHSVRDRWNSQRSLRWQSSKRPATDTVFGRIATPVLQVENQSGHGRKFRWVLSPRDGALF
jgi:hypothetical protein